MASFGHARIKALSGQLPGTRHRSGIFPWLPLIAIFFALRALLARGFNPLGYFDEALLFTDAYLMRKGFTIYSDFHFCYPPGILQVVRAVLGLHLPAIWTVRLLALLVRIASGVCAGLLVGRFQGRRFCFWTCATVMVLQEQLGLVFFAYPVALMLALLIILIWPAPGAPRWRGIACGVLFGVVSYVRHDLVTYAFAVLISVEALWWATKRESLLMESAARLRDFALAAVGSALALWLPVFVRSGISRPLHDIVIDMATRIMPGRKLPVLPLTVSMRIGTLGVDVPAGLADVTRVCLTIAIAAAIALIVAILLRGFRAQRGNDQDSASKQELRTLVLVAAFALSTLPQATFRFDYPHTAFGIPITVTALLALGPRLREPVLLIALLTWFVTPPPMIGWDGTKQLWRQRADESFVAPDRLEVVRFLRRESKPGEPFFSGCYTHRRTLASNLDLHYLARRPGATQYMIFDPGTTASVAGQQEMIADLSRTRPKLVLRGPGCFWDEPNDSLKEGSTLLDEYLDQHYAFDTQVGAWAIWRPRSPS